MLGQPAFPDNHLEISVSCLCHMLSGQTVKSQACSAQQNGALISVELLSLHFTCTQKRISMDLMQTFRYNY